jgi:hypothetical protein
VLSRLHGYAQPHDPDDPDAQELLLRAVETAFFSCGGSAAALAAAAPVLSGQPHAAAALLAALHHLKAAGIVHRLLPSATLRLLPSLAADGAPAAGAMLLDATAVRTLELLEGSLGGPQGSLLAFLDRAVSPAGRRKLRAWVSRPLFRVRDIEERLDTVQALMHCPEVAGAFQRALRSSPDCERLAPKVAELFAGVAAAARRARGEDLEDSGQEGEHLLGLEGGEKAWAAVDEAVAFEHAASVLELTQGAFLPAVKLFEGLGM